MTLQCVCRGCRDLIQTLANNQEPSIYMFNLMEASKVMACLKQGKTEHTMGSACDCSKNKSSTKKLTGVLFASHTSQNAKVLKQCGLTIYSKKELKHQVA